MGPGREERMRKVRLDHSILSYKSSIIPPLQKLNDLMLWLVAFDRWMGMDEMDTGTLSSSAEDFHHCHQGMHTQFSFSFSLRTKFFFFFFFFFKERQDVPPPAFISQDWYCTGSKAKWRGEEGWGRQMWGMEWTGSWLNPGLGTEWNFTDLIYITCAGRLPFAFSFVSCWNHPKSSQSVPWLIIMSCFKWLGEEPVAERVPFPDWIWSSRSTHLTPLTDHYQGGLIPDPDKEKVKKKNLSLEFVLGIEVIVTDWLIWTG